MLLNILISTIDNGINKVGKIILDKHSDIQYIVSHHFTKEEFKFVPEDLLRDDVIISQMPGKGLSKSRNNSIMIATGDIGLFSDDDVNYTNEYFDSIINTFIKEKPDIAIFKIKTPKGEPEYKNYPQNAYQLSLSNMHSPSTIEIAFNINSIKNKLKFDERFGLGTYLGGGEEVLFIKDAIKQGLKVWYYPLYVVQHSQISTIKKYSKYHKKRIIVYGAMYARKYGWLSIPVIFLKTIMLWPDLIKNRRSLFVYLTQVYCGCFYILFNRKN